jgi:ATP-dependent RNA helicase RhlE
MSVRTVVFLVVLTSPKKTTVYQGYIVGTPGRIMDLTLDNVIRFEEMQNWLSMRRNVEFRVSYSVDCYFSNDAKKRQNILFSATMTDEVDAILNDYFDYPQEVTLSASGTPLENIKQIAYDAVNFNTKVNLLKHLLQENEDMSRVLIFS